MHADVVAARLFAPACRALQLQRDVSRGDTTEADLIRRGHRWCDRAPALAAVVAAGLACSALGAPIRYVGAHPVAERAGGGFCQVEAPHLHSYAPAPSAFYVATPAGYGFVGDPTPFGYAGERHIY